ncbi:hypothetical protein Pmani_038377 [Petrolisthes manimaculis]|uniref:Uncharacterized protein n=1 Tax=Petrolisthes manimaculis TaxID=1843537 RepID=A0AAE1NH17_9EUCA|nr:hypothetical protein Pmani_038377 [Petrolisthes manimaculis]
MTWVCEDGWQRWWGANTKVPLNNTKVPLNTPIDQPLKLRLELVYEDERRLTSNFSSVSVLSGKLSVGNYTGGDAGNWWEAPFQSRSLVFDDERNCMPFYSPYGDCVSNKTMSVEEQLVQYNGTIEEFGFVWTVGDEEYDQLNITKIYLWVTCVNCTITGQEEEEGEGGVVDL